MIELISEITQKAGADFALLDDSAIRGSLHCVNAISDLDTIPRTRLKDGTLIMVATPTKALYVYNELSDDFDAFATNNGGGGDGDTWIMIYGNGLKKTDNLETYVRTVEIDETKIITQVRNYSYLESVTASGTIYVREDYTDDIIGTVYQNGFYRQIDGVWTRVAFITNEDILLLFDTNANDELTWNGNTFFDGSYNSLADVPMNIVTDANYVHTDNNYDDVSVEEVAKITNKVDKIEGKGLSTEDYSSAEKEKLENIEENANVNTIESISLNGTALTPDVNKNVNIIVTGGGGSGGGASTWSDLSNKPFSNVGTNGLEIISDSVDVDFTKVQSIMSDATTTISGKMSSTDKIKLDSVEEGAEVNLIESVSLNSVPGIIDENKNINLVYDNISLMLNNIINDTQIELYREEVVDSTYFNRIPGINDTFTAVIKGIGVSVGRSWLATLKVTEVDANVCCTIEGYVETTGSRGQNGGGSVLNVNTDVSCAGLTVTATNLTETITGIVDGTGRCVLNPNGIGTYTVSIVSGGTIYCKTIVIPYYGVYDVTIEGEFNYATWITLAGLDSSQYETLNSVLDDEKAVRAVLTKHDSVDYLYDFMSNSTVDIQTFLNNDYFAKWTNLRAYAYDKFVANALIKAVMDSVGKYGVYWTLQPQIPVMTNNNTPSGYIASASTQYNSSTHGAFMAFQNTPTVNGWAATEQTGYLQIELPIAKTIIKFHLGNRIFLNYVDAPKNFQIWGSNDNFITHDLLGTYVNNNNTSGYIKEYFITSPSSYKYYRMVIADVINTSRNICVGMLQLYAYEAKGLVPIMTSNTAPEGVASASSEQLTSVQAWKAFNGTVGTADCWSTVSNTTLPAYIAYKFINPTIVSRVMIYERYENNYTVDTTVTLQGSNDNFVSDIHDLGNMLLLSSKTNQEQYFDISNTDAYMSYRIKFTTKNVNTDSGYCQIAKLQFYGRQLDESVPLMTGDNTPIGEVIHSSEHTTYPTWQAFDNNDSTIGLCNDSVNGYVGYNFNKPICIKQVYIKQNNGSIFKIQGSNNGGTWDDLSDPISLQASDSTFIILNNTKSYNRYRALCSSMLSGVKFGFCTMQLYGQSYSEEELAENSKVVMLYDNGVKINDVSFTNVTSYNYFKEQYDYIECNDISTSSGCYALYSIQQNIVFDGMIKFAVCEFIDRHGTQPSQSIYIISQPSIGYDRPASSYVDIFTNKSNTSQQTKGRLVVDCSSINGSYYLALSSDTSDVGITHYTKLYLLK